MFQLPLFSAEDPVIAELRVLDVNSLSPLAALNKLYELQQRAQEGGVRVCSIGATAAGML